MPSYIEYPSDHFCGETSCHPVSQFIILIITALVSPSFSLSPLNLSLYCKTMHTFLKAYAMPF